MIPRKSVLEFQTWKGIPILTPDLPLKERIFWSIEVLETYFNEPMTHFGFPVAWKLTRDPIEREISWVSLEIYPFEVEDPSVPCGLLTLA